jgi:hypothetical protein
MCVTNGMTNAVLLAGVASTGGLAAALMRVGRWVRIGIARLRPTGQ